jgi:hypothetical protein
MKGFVKRVYIVDPLFKTFTRGLLDEFGLVFQPGYGWSTKSSFQHIVELPGLTARKEWDWDGWWESNWQDVTWAWCYMYPNSFKNSREKIPERAIRKLEKRLREQDEKSFKLFMEAST